ncbi:uncharacterized protein LOC134798143 [Cydia splendana]|uniref:uncharacterized protein LOC134798143 n=1 Tax=Cydia splendana TaxID=1100963 RepID=UPI00300D7DB8
MALLLLLVLAVGAGASTPGGEVALANVTRFATGDAFALVSSDCGMTRCMEESHGTALPMGGQGCVCQCGQDKPAFREDQRTCVGHIDECVMASFGRGATKTQIPLVFLPMKGQIMYPSKEIVFTDVEDAVCAVTSAQYLSPSGWVTLRDLLDNDVPFGLYRDEGSTFLQWRGSTTLHNRLEGRLVAVHVLCSAPTPTRLAASCAAFRVAGASHNIDVRSIPFHAGEIVTAEPATQSQGLSVLESLAIGVCVLMLVFVYAAGIVFYVHYKQRQKRKEKDPEMNFSSTMSTDNGSTLDSRIGLDSMRMKTNPLMKLDGDFLNDAGLSDVSERTEETMDSYTSEKFQKMNPNVVSAMVHNSRMKKKPIRPSVRTATTPERVTERLQRRSASPDTFERAPHSDLSIVDYRVENATNQPPQSNGEPAIRRKLYFNPVFFETEHLKNPPPAALEFLEKIREVMSIAKEKMTSKRFIPILSDIPEEELYHTIDLGWDIPCARRGRRFSAISLKRENSRRAVHCGGCPGCDSSEREQKAKVALARSNSCKTCVSDDYKQKIVRKWLDDVPLPPNSTKAVKPVAVAKVSGTPRVSEPKTPELPRQSPEPIRIELPKPIKITETNLKEALHAIPHVRLDSRKEIRRGSDQKNTKGDNAIDIAKEEPKTKAPTMVTLDKRSPSSHATRRVRKRLPPPPPPPNMPPSIPKSEEEPVASEVKAKMKAVIQELNQCRRGEPKELEELKTEKIAPIAPKIVIPVLAADSHYFSDDNLLETRRREPFINFDSLERNNLLKKRRFSLACGPEISMKDITPYQPHIPTPKQRLSQSWRDVRKAVEGHQVSSAASVDSEYENRSLPVSEVFINTMEPLYNNLPKPGALTIQVSGSPVEKRRNLNDDFDPDTLDRKPRREIKKRVDKILLKSGGSFKHKFTEIDSKESKSPDIGFTRKIGSLRQIYEAKTKVQDDSLRLSFYERRGSVPYGTEEVSRFVAALKTPDLIRQVNVQDVRPPVPPKQRQPNLSPKFSTPTRESPPGERRRALEERDRFPPYSRAENLNARRSGRRLPRTRSRRTDLRKLYKTEDSGYMSTDSNESKRRARYLMQLRPPKTTVPEHTMMPSITVTNKTPPLQIESDTDDLESLCDGRSESGGESVETDSVFFGNFDESKQMLAELGMYNYDGQKRIQSQEQIDSGFMGETNIILSGDSDSEHRSVISIIAGRDGRASAASIAQLDDPPFVHSVEC